MATRPLTPKDHDQASEVLTAKLHILWEQRREISVRAEKFTVLTLAHYVLSRLPDATQILLEPSDQAVDSMVFCSAAVPNDTTGVLDYFSDEEGELDENVLWDLACSIDPEGINNYPFWVATGPPTSGYIDIAKLWETWGDEDRLVSAAPMPDPSNLPAVEAWLARTWTAFYVSADGPGDDSTWSVYREQYISDDDDSPIDGTQEHVSQHENEDVAIAEAGRLQQTEGGYR